MIVVIADDLSGAAELANAALAAGLSAEVQLRFSADSKADVICIDTASRSLDPSRAAAVAAETAERVAAARPAFVYKKCDSLLRGNVAVEALAIARALGRARVLLAPANPSRHRLIQGGRYWVDGFPLHQTPFAQDPEHPRLTSQVSDLLGPAPGVEIPDAASPGDLLRHAVAVDDRTLPAGGVDFFTALLSTKGFNRPTQAPEWQRRGRALFVCGSGAAWQADRAGECAAGGLPVFPMPRALFERVLREEILVRWGQFAAAGLRDRNGAMLALGGERPDPGVTSEMLNTRLAQAAELTLAAQATDQVFLEGGATAYTIITQLGLTRFAAQPSPGPGIGALCPVGEVGPLFLIKPGSYRWPQKIWEPATP